MHAHLDHDSCMEVTILRGKTDKVRNFAEHVIAERGVRHGRVVLVPTDVLAKPTCRARMTHRTTIRTRMPGRGARRTRTRRSRLGERGRRVDPMG